MLDLKTQSQLVEAGASVMRWYVLAAASMSAASAARTFALWAALLDPAAAAPANPTPMPAAAQWPAAPEAAGTAYRSAGGHAVAQVVIAPTR